MKKILIGFIIVGLLIPIILTITIRIKENLLKEGVIVQASREAPVGGIWLGLYNDQHFNIGHYGFFGTEVRVTGLYQIKADTLFLRAYHKSEYPAFKKNLCFLIVDNDALTEISQDSGKYSGRIGELMIWKNPKWKHLVN